MNKDKSHAQLVNVVEFPPDKMEAVVKALRPILGVDEQGAAVTDIPGAGTGCTRTAVTGSSDWSCTDAVAFE